MRYTILQIVAVLSLLSPATLLAQIRGVAPEANAAATIGGRITAVDTGRPLRGARVQLSAPELPTARVTATDIDGRYEFSNLPAGRYTMSATMASFIGLSYGQTRPFEAGKPIVLVEKQRVDNIDLRLPRGGAIAGMVLDDAGQPLVNAAVTAYRTQFVRGVRQFVSSGAVRTSDSGEFRLFGLSPGSYVVSASKSFGLSPQWATVNAESGFAHSYFPGTPNASEAGRVTVRLGQTTNAINFALTSAKVGSIGGSLFTVDGRAATLGIAEPRIRRIGDAQRSTGVTLSGDGVNSTFRASALPPGDYEISAMSMPLASSTIPQQGIVQRLTLNGENVSGIRLVMELLPQGSGRLVVDPTATGTPPVAAIRIGTQPVDPASALSTQPATPGADMSFTLSAPPGHMLIRPTLPRGWALKAVRVENQDVTDTGIEFRSGAPPVRNIEVEITNRLTELSGTARNSRNEPADDFTVIVFSRDSERWKGDPRHFATARPDQNGRFAVSGLSAGDYYAVALDYLDPGDAQDPELLERLRRDATSFSLADGQSLSLELKVIP